MTKTGLPDVDKLLASDDAIVEPMIIDQVQFDNVLLPLLTNSVDLPADEVFTHLRTMWTNYYRDQHRAGTMIEDANGKLVSKPVSGNAVFTPMKIVDSEGNTVAITPPLIEPMIVAGSGNVLLEYINEMRHNPNVASTKLVNSMSKYKLPTSNKWGEFIQSYTGTVNTVMDEELFIME